MKKMLTVEETSLLFQEDNEYLSSTKSQFSLEFNEDLYIKSSIIKKQIIHFIQKKMVIIDKRIMNIILQSVDKVQYSFLL